MLPQSCLAAWLLLAPFLSVSAQQPGTFVQAGNTLVSAMMMFVGNADKVYILDKAEGNPVQVNGHPAWGAVFDIPSQTYEVMDVSTNVFCASGYHLPNGSFVTFGGNSAVTVGGKAGSDLYPGDIYDGIYDATYGDYDGRKAIRVLDPCTGDVDAQGTQCGWFDNSSLLTMQEMRWYSAAEALGDGSVAIIGGFSSGGYVNRNFPNVDPTYEGNASQPTFEFFPSKGAPQLMQFMTETSGLNAYALSFLMPDGQMFLQANLSSMLWDPSTNVETPLPPMPNGVVRVYPASGANAMLPLTPENNWTPTILFCGGSDMPADAYGNYANPAIDTWNYPASPDCQRITPEPQDGSPPVYTQDDDLPVPRTMGQFILLPDQTMLIINGGTNGTAGYATATGETPNEGDMPFGMSLGSGPVGTPAIYNPNAPAGQRWSSAGLGSSNIARLYHSSAILLPDGSVYVAGSNPNVDVNTSTIYPTTYTAEFFYPPYFSAKNRPAPQGVPTSLTYGGDFFNITVPATSYAGDANDAADNTTVMVMRQGFTTHAMNMGQRAMQLNSTYSVNSDGSYDLHVSPPPPNANLLQPGPVFIYVVVKGIPSNGTYAIVGNGQIGTQPTTPPVPLPNVVRLDGVQGAGSNATVGSGSSGTSPTGTSHTALIIGGIAGVVVIIGIIGAAITICLRRRSREAARSQSKLALGGAPSMGVNPLRRGADNDSGLFVPLQADAWNASSASLPPSPSPYKDHPFARGATPNPSGEFAPYPEVQHHMQGQDYGAPRRQQY